MYIGFIGCRLKIQNNYSVSLMFVTGSHQTIKTLNRQVQGTSSGLRRIENDVGKSKNDEVRSDMFITYILIT